MSENDSLQWIVADLIRTLQLLAKELERLVGQIEHSLGPVRYKHEFSAVASELGNLLVRTKKLEG